MIINKAVFLDRDGIINIDNGYIFKKEDFKFTKGIFDFLKNLQLLGYKLFIITNQSGIARGYYTEDDFHKLNDFMLNEFKKNGINIEKVKYCPHHILGIIEKYSVNCNCRKPNSGMIEDILKEYNIDIKSSFMIGDKESDIIAGKNVGLKTILVNNNYNFKIKADFIVSDLGDLLNLKGVF